jgi:AraC family transcriptional regulator
MDVRMVEREAFTLFGLQRVISAVDGKNLKEIPQFWQDFYKDGYAAKLNPAGNRNSYGVCANFNQAEQQFDYWIAVEDAGQAVDEEFARTSIPASTWAVFTSVGPMPHAIQAVWKAIHSEWFPNQPYVSTGGPELEVYFPGDPMSEDYRCEVWIPVRPK